VENSSLLNYAEDTIRLRKRERKREKERERGRERKREGEKWKIVSIPYSPLHFMGFTKTVLTHTNHCERESQGT